jgi:exosome complex RNA-binding protein Rrp42 (RNase PH superfamily)
MEVFRTLFPEEYHAKFLEYDVRIDGRKLGDVRKTVISTGTCSTERQKERERAVCWVSDR